VFPGTRAAPEACQEDTLCRLARLAGSLDVAWMWKEEEWAACLFFSAGLEPNNDRGRRARPRGTGEFWGPQDTGRAVVPV